jgi:hypothetical protein
VAERRADHLREKALMLRAIFTIGLFAVLGLVALKVVFGVLAGLLGLFFWMVTIAAKIALFGLAAYLIVRVVSPGTARRLRDRWSGTPS